MANAVPAEPTSIWAPAADGWWRRSQAIMVDRLKCLALARLHQCRSGERWLIEMYLRAEELGEMGGLSELEGTGFPDWLREQMVGHLEDEARHVRMLRAVVGGPPHRPHALPDPITRWKMAASRRVAQDCAACFAAGAAVTSLAMGLVAEELAVRFMLRYLAVLDAHPPRDEEHRSLPGVLRSILADEQRHVRMLDGALDRLVVRDERPQLEALLGRLRSIDRDWGITGALGLLAVAYLRGRS